MERNIHFQDNSGDKKYFTIIPNYIANHSTANDQALYFQMKRYAGEEGKCFASKQTLMQKLGIGRKALHKSIKYLIDHGWISFAGVKPVYTNGGLQNIDVYTVNDIWKKNQEFYEGQAKRAPLSSKGRPKEQKGRLEVHKGAAERATNKINYKEQEEDSLILEERKKLTQKYKPDFLKNI